jgi:hypothetical protein
MKGEPNKKAEKNRTKKTAPLSPDFLLRVAATLGMTNRRG